jgi:beta-galactosidase
MDPSRYITAGINGIFAAGEFRDSIMNDVMREVEEERRLRAEESRRIQGQTDDADGKSKAQPCGNINEFMAEKDAHMSRIVVHDRITVRLDRACAYLDVAGYNYMTARYAKDAVERPWRVMVGSETYPPQIAENWREVQKFKQVIGDFTWTAWDYIGEAGIGIPGYKPGEGGFGALFPAQLAYTGDFDLTGFRRPVSYFREIVFGLRQEPYIAVQDPHHYGEKLLKTPWVMSDAVSTWTWKDCEGKPVIVEVYAPGDEVELLLNGKSIGRKPSGPKTDFRTIFELTYNPGCLEAVVYEAGKEISRSALSTAGETSDIVIGSKEEVDILNEYRKVTGHSFDAHMQNELIYLPVLLTDDSGSVVTGNDMELSISVTGGALLMGFGSGDPKPLHNYNEGTTRTWNGRALAVLRRISDEEICVKAAAGNMQREMIIGYSSQVRDL